MKRTSKFLTAAIIAGSIAVSAHAQWAVFDATGFTQMIADYAMQAKMFSDQVQQTISVATQLKNQVEDMKSFGENFFTGDQIAALTGVYLEATGMTDLLHKADEKLNGHVLFEMNGNSYTLADMLGIGKRTYMDFASDCTYAVNSELRAAANEWAGNLTHAEDLYIMDRYGVSSSDYFLAQKATEAADEAMDLAMQQCDSLRTLEVQKSIMDQYQDIQKRLESAGLSGRVSTTQLAEASAKMAQLQGVQLAEISQAITSYMNMQILKDYQESVKAKAREDYNAAMTDEQLRKLEVSTVPEYWKHK